MLFHHEAQKFVILCSPRTGSNYLATLLFSQPAIKYYGEFHGRFYNTTVDTLREVFKPTNKLVRGMKLFYQSLMNLKSDGSIETREDLFDYLRKERVKTIHLKRENLLDTVLSNTLVRTNGEGNPIDWPWCAKHYEKTTSISYEMCMKEMSRLKMIRMRADHYLNTMGIPHLDAYYSLITKDPQGTLDKVCDFLGIGRCEVNPSHILVRQREGSQKDNLDNYCELYERFKGTEFEKYFEESC